MKFEIAKEIQKCTTECKNAFNCLVDNSHRLCPVAECVDGEIYYIKCLDNNECDYQESVYRLYYKCTCPVRMEIYDKYKL